MKTRWSLVCGGLMAVGFASGVLAPSAARAQADAYRGLWVGEVKLMAVNEATVALDENNVPTSSDPAVPTPTGDIANLRLLLHVNGAGQVSLLKDVAIVRRGEADELVVGSEVGMALVTDERLYGEVPPQPARRLASVLFDFGDSRTTEILDAMTAAVCAEVADVVGAATDFETDTGRQAALAAAEQAAAAAAAPLAEAADVRATFAAFLASDMAPGVVDAIAADPGGSAAQDALLAASNVLARSSYGDRRALDMVNAVMAAAASAPSNAAAAAHEVAAVYADVEDLYPRFLAGHLFQRMLDAAATAAGQAAAAPSATLESIRAAVDAEPVVMEALAETLRIKALPYNDARGATAVERVLQAAVAAAHATAGGASDKAAAALSAATEALSSAVRRFAVPTDTPTPDYNAFVASEAFTGVPAAAAAAAAAAAVSERRNNGLWTAQSLALAAEAGVRNALRSEFAAAARTVRTSLPLNGILAPGSGDDRLRWAISQETAAPLGPGGLTGTIYLPAHHPTNPFRHRRHPDHTRGFDIVRHVRLDVAGEPGDALEPAGYGVDRLTGIYREEVFGLHKPLGPSQDIGLRAEGPFELTRISLIDALNAL